MSHRKHHNIISSFVDKYDAKVIGIVFRSHELQCYTRYMKQYQARAIIIQTITMENVGTKCTKNTSLLT